MVYTGKQIEQAKLCALLTGSYEGKTNSCDCENRDECWFTAEEVSQLKKHPDIVEVSLRNRDEFWDIETKKLVEESKTRRTV